MALKLVKDSEQRLQPHRQALRDNLRAIKETRARVTAIHEKDMAASHDIAAADETQARIQTLQEAIDTARAEAAYNNDPPPDLKHMERQLADAHQLHKRQSDVARAASKIREKYTADMASLNAVITEHVRQTRRLLWVALREEELAGLADEFLAKEKEMLDVLRRVFAAALASDTIAREQAYGEFSASANINDLQIPRPAHDAFVREALTVEQGHAARREYMKSIEQTAATLERELLAVAD
jgi:hypothetical protein